MNLKDFYNDLSAFYQKSSKVFEMFFDKYTFICYDMSEYARVYVIEDCFVVYFAIKKIIDPTDDDVDYYSKNNYGRFSTLTGHILVIEELTYNELFKINATKLRKAIFGKDALYAPYIYKFFNANIDKPIRSLNLLEEEEFNAGKLDHLKTNFYAVSDAFPFLELKNRVDNWKGMPHTFIIFELTCNGKHAYAVDSTTSPYVTRYILNAISDMEKNTRQVYMAFEFIDGKPQVRKDLLEKSDRFPEFLAYNNISEFDELLLCKLYQYYMERKTNPQKDHNLHPRFIPSNCIKYWTFIDYQKADFFPEKYEDILNNIAKYLQKCLQPTEYIRTESRWKSEELMYECVKKVFSKNEVVHQHRPYFLHTKKGQMSYDVFVYGEKIAFEYQGKQHFEPIDYFGGKEHFEEQRGRDVLKKRLSEENGIILIYVNYWEDISIELIKKKISDAVKQKSGNMNKYYLK